MSRIYGRDIGVPVAQNPAGLRGIQLIVNMLMIHMGMNMPAFHQTLPMMLNLTLDAAMPVYRELFARYDLTEQQWRILRVLWTTDDIRSADLSDRTLLPKPSLVGILDRLEAKVLVQRVRSTTDRRNVTIATTAKGRALAQEVLPQANAIHEHIQALVSPSEWTAIETGLRVLTEKMQGMTLADVAAPRDTGTPRDTDTPRAGYQNA